MGNLSTILFSEDGGYEALLFFCFSEIGLFALLFSQEGAAQNLSVVFASTCPAPAAFAAAPAIMSAEADAPFFPSPAQDLLFQGEVP